MRKLRVFCSSQNLFHPSLLVDSQGCPPLVEYCTGQSQQPPYLPGLSGQDLDPLLECFIDEENSDEYEEVPISEALPCRYSEIRPVETFGVIKAKFQCQDG